VLDVERSGQHGIVFLLSSKAAGGLKQLSDASFGNSVEVFGRQGRVYEK